MNTSVVKCRLLTGSYESSIDQSKRAIFLFEIVFTRYERSFCFRRSLICRMSNVSSSLGNTKVRVVVRVRPENDKEVGSKAIVRVVDNNILVFDPKDDNAPQFQRVKRRPVITKKPKDLQFAFDRVFDCTCTQDDVFKHTTKGKCHYVLGMLLCCVCVCCLLTHRCIGLVLCA